MFSKISLLAVSSFIILAASKPVPQTTTTTTNQCNTGAASCCNSVSSATNPATATLLGLLGIVVQGIDGQVGLNCVPISVVSLAGGTDCAQQPVCCTGVNGNGLVNVGCTPISI